MYPEKSEGTLLDTDYKWDLVSNEEIESVVTKEQFKNATYNII